MDVAGAESEEKEMMGVESQGRCSISRALQAKGLKHSFLTLLYSYLFSLLCTLFIKSLNIISSLITNMIGWLACIMLPSPQVAHKPMGDGACSPCCYHWSPIELKCGLASFLTLHILPVIAFMPVTSVSTCMLTVSSPTGVVCPGLRSFPGCGNFSAKISHSPKQISELVQGLPNMFHFTSPCVQLATRHPHWCFIAILNSTGSILNSCSLPSHSSSSFLFSMTGPPSYPTV